MTENDVKESSPAGLRLVLWSGLGLAILVALGAGAFSLLGRPATPGSSTDALEEPAQAFSLTDQTGRSVTRADLDGKVWIANFIFTRCPTVCPTLTREMAQVRQQLSKEGA